MSQDDRFLGMSSIAEPYGIRMLVGVNAHEVLDASAGNVTPVSIENSRALKVDGSGIIKIDYVDDDGTTHTEVLHVVEGVFYEYRNVRNLYRYYVGTTALTAKAYTDAGVLTTGAIKIYR